MNVLKMKIEFELERGKQSSQPAPTRKRRAGDEERRTLQHSVGKIRGFRGQVYPIINYGMEDTRTEADEAFYQSDEAVLY